MTKLPVVSGQDLVTALAKIGYLDRQTNAISFCAIICRRLAAWLSLPAKQPSTGETPVPPIFTLAELRVGVSWGSFQQGKGADEKPWVPSPAIFSGKSKAAVLTAKR